MIDEFLNRFIEEIIGFKKTEVFVAKSGITRRKKILPRKNVSTARTCQKKWGKNEQVKKWLHNQHFSIS